MFRRNAEETFNSLICAIFGALTV